MNNFEKSMTKPTPKQESPSNEKLVNGDKKRPGNNNMFSGIEGMVVPGNKFISKDGEVFVFSKTEGEEAILIPEQEKNNEDMGTVRKVNHIQKIPADKFGEQFERTGGEIFLKKEPFKLEGNEFPGADALGGKLMRITEVLEDQNMVKISGPEVGEKIIAIDDLPAKIAFQENDHVVYEDGQGNIKSGKVFGSRGEEISLGLPENTDDETIERPKIKISQVIGKAKASGEAQKLKTEMEEQKAQELMAGIKGVEERKAGKNMKDEIKNKQPEVEKGKVEWPEVSKKADELDKIIDSLKISPEQKTELHNEVINILRKNTDPSTADNLLTDFQIKKINIHRY